MAVKKPRTKEFTLATRTIISLIYKPVGLIKSL